MDKKVKSKTILRMVIIAATLLFVSSFAFIIVCGLLKDYGYGDFWWPLVGLVGFFACAVLTLILLLSIMNDALLYDMEDKNNQYDAADFSLLSNVSPAAVQKQLTAHRFTESSEGFLHRKIISLTKDCISYYAKCLPVKELEAALEEEFQRFDALDKTAKNVCLLLFLYKAHPTAADFSLVRETAKTFLISETLLPVHSFQTCVLILVDLSSEQGSYLAIQRKGSISVYAHACRLLKRYFSPRTPFMALFRP